MRAVPAMLAVIALTACNRQPPHYMFCELADNNGWELVDVEYDRRGYIVACSYHAPDGSRTYTARCDKSGCD